MLPVAVEARLTVCDSCCDRMWCTCVDVTELVLSELFQLFGFTIERHSNSLPNTFVRVQPDTFEA
jgi:hypothetical protein